MNDITTIRKIIDCLPFLLFVIFPLTIFNIENPDFQTYLAIVTFATFPTLLE